MAKKKAVKVKVKVAPKAKAKKAAKPAAKPKAAKKALRQPALPGTEQIRNRSLDGVCEGISDVRATMSRSRGEEQDLTRRAVVVMQRDKITAYRSSGVELVLVPGDVKLRVRTLKDTANADAPAPEVKGDDDEPGVTSDEIADEQAEYEGDGDEA